VTHNDPVIKFTANGNWIVANVPAEAAHFMSRALADLSQTLEHTARDQKQRDLEKVAQIHYSRHVDVMVEMMIDEGKSLDVAIRMLANYDISEHQTRFLWKMLHPRVKRKNRMVAQKKARQLARHGKSNSEIATILACSTRTVSRLLNPK